MIGILNVQRTVFIIPSHTSRLSAMSAPTSKSWGQLIEISKLRGEISSLRIPTDRMERERKTEWRFLNVKAICVVGRGIVLKVRAETPHVNEG